MSWYGIATVTTHKVSRVNKRRTQENQDRDFVDNAICKVHSETQRVRTRTTTSNRS